MQLNPCFFFFSLNIMNNFRFDFACPDDFAGYALVHSAVNAKADGQNTLTPHVYFI